MSALDDDMAASTSCSVSPTAGRPIRRYPFTSVQPSPLPSNLKPEDAVHMLRKALCADNERCEWGQVQVWAREDKEFKIASAIFNGAIKTHALALVKPLNANDVSRTIKFCRAHKLELSIKAGGYGVHGWSVAGHIILDLSLLNQVSVSLPTSATTLQESFEKLRIPSPKTENKRPSLAETHEHSSESNSNTKRSAPDAWSDGSDSDLESRRKKTDNVNEKRSRGSSGSSRDAMGDHDMSRGSSRGHQSGSGSGSGTGSRSGRGSSAEAHTTPATSSFSGSSKAPDTLAQSPSVMSPDTSAPPQLPIPPQPRVTYVNPSPTTAVAHSFPANYYPAGSSSSSSAFNSYNPGLQLNTNPDPPPYTLVTFGAGIKSKELDAVTSSSPYGAFHVPTSAFPVGSGQFVSGGFGFSGRKHGLAMDNVVEAEIVLADGRIVWVGEGGKHGGDWKEGEDPTEVWWALRGAGAIFGVITRFQAKAYYYPSVYAGNFIYMFDRQTSPSLMRHVRDCIKGASRDVYTNMIMTAGPPGAPAIVVIQLCFLGSRAEGDKYIQAIGSWDGGRPLLQEFSERTFERQQVAIEEVLRGGDGRKWFIKSDFLRSMTDEVIDQTCQRFRAVPDGCTWLFEFTGGGAVSDTKDSCFPNSHRESAFTVAALHQWAHTEAVVQDNLCVSTAENWINEVIHPNSPGGPLPCFVQSATEEAVAGVYGESLPRLKALKALIDPDNFFRHAMWPRPGAPDDRRQIGDARYVTEAAFKGKSKETVPNDKQGPSAVVGDADDKPEVPGVIADMDFGPDHLREMTSSAEPRPSSDTITVNQEVADKAMEIPGYQRSSGGAVEPVTGGESRVM